MKFHRTHIYRCLAVMAASFFIAATGLQAEESVFQIKETGMASWYGQEFKGKKTSSGELFDPEQFTAAHRLLPFGAIVTVTNLQNGKSVKVKINDRGPFVEGRSIDLSKAAAEALGMIGSGVAKVQIETTLTSLPAGLVVETGVIKEAPAKPAAAPAALATAPVPAEDPLRVIQIASYSNRDSALNLIKYLYDNGVEAVEEIPGNGIYRVVIQAVVLSKVAAVQANLAQLGFPQVLIRQK